MKQKVHCYRPLGLLCLLFLPWVVQAMELKPITGEDSQPPLTQEGAPVLGTPSPKEAVEPIKPKVPASESATSPKLPEGGDKKAELNKFFGEMKPLLAEAQKVEAYLIGPELADASVPEESKLAGYPVLKEPVVLTESQVKVFQALLLDEKSYFWGPAQKCLLYPHAALRFLKGEAEIVVLLSTKCKLWSFAYQGKLKTKDYSPVGKTVGEFLTTLFPKEFPAETQ